MTATELPPSAAATEGEPDTDAPDEGRRRFLGRGAIAAATAAVGVVALGGKAEAADGNAILINGINAGSTAGSNTRLNGSQFTVTANIGAYTIKGESTDGIGVWGDSGSSSAAGVGVKGTATIGGSTGVLGENSGTSGGIGVHGTSTDGYGVSGSSNSGVGVVATGGTGSVRGTGVYSSAPIGPSLQLAEASLAIPPTGAWVAGSFVVEGGHVWYCYKSGTGSAAGWVKLSGAPVILGTQYRCYDSRPADPPLLVTKGVLTDGATRTGIDLTVNGGVNKIPTGISAAIINLTATGTSAAGYLAAFKNGIGWPGTSTLNWSAANTNIANTTVVAVDALSKISVRGAGQTHFLIDVIGYLP